MQFLQNYAWNYWFFNCHDRYVHKKFRQQYKATIGADFLTKSGLELKRDIKILVPTASFGGSSNDVNASVDNTTFNTKESKGNNVT